MMTRETMEPYGSLVRVTGTGCGGTGVAGSSLVMVREVDLVTRWWEGSCSEEVGRRVVGEAWSPTLN